MRYGATLSFRYKKNGDQYYTNTSYHYRMWEECLTVFDAVVVGARTYETESIAEADKPTVGEKVSFVEFPDTNGFLSVLYAIPIMFLKAKKYSLKADIWCLRSTNFISFCMCYWLNKYKIPYILELTGSQSVDINFLTLRGIKFPGLIQKIMLRVLKYQLKNPLAIISVSHSLVRDFPPLNNCPTYVISDNRMNINSYKDARDFVNGGLKRIIATGNVQAQKNPIGTINSLALLEKAGYTDWEFVWIGDGPLIEKCQGLAKQLNIDHKVKFLGRVPWEKVSEYLNNSDLYILHSVNEGLPRSMMEAMACALPCIGTDVGGISELISSDDIVPPQNDEAFALKMFEVLSSPERMNEMSKRNITKAYNYSSEKLIADKLKFYQEIKDLVQNNKDIGNG